MPKSTKYTPAEFCKHFLAKKSLHGPKQEPVWVYLEREMIENIDKKPYNKKVGDWLRFLKDLKRYLYLERKKRERMLQKEGGPSWFMEMSGFQKEILRNLEKNVHYDLIEALPRRTRKSLSDLGITRSISTRVLLKAMRDGGGDAAVFIWKLYTAIYNMSPGELRKKYDMDAMLLISALTFIDIDECVENLVELTKPAEETPKPEKKKEVKKKKTVKYNCRYGMYLEESIVPVYCTHPPPQRRVKRPPPRMEKKITIRSDGSYENLRIDYTFLERRLQRVKAKRAKRASAKPQESAASQKRKNKAMEKYLNLISQSAKPTHLSSIAVANLKFNIGPVVLVGGRPRYLLNNIAVLQTGYIINGGTAVIPGGEKFTIIAGVSRFPVQKEEKCDETCDCIHWERAVKKFLEESKCKCAHLYDYYHEGKSLETYFYPPTKHWPMWFDEAKIFQLDPMEDFIKEAVRLAERSEEVTPVPSRPELLLSTTGTNLQALLRSLLADLSDTALVIPHLPEAFRLNNLLEWVRKRFQGELSPAAHKSLLVKSLRRWCLLERVNFLERAYLIPFTRKEFEEISWADRQNLQALSEALMRDFTSRNRLRQVEQTRMWWSTMQYDKYPSQAFLDVYFTYMPGRTKDTYIYNPYNSELTPKDIYKCCPLRERS